jgi:carbamoyltransferase
MIILGLTFGHDAAACLIVDGVVVADAAEERFSRVKHDAGFPAAAIAYCLKEGDYSSEQVEILALAGQFLPSGLERHFMLSQDQTAALAACRPIESRARHLILSSGQHEMPLYVERVRLSPRCRLHIVQHHLAHAAAAFFTRGRSDRCMIATMDGIGDNVSAAIWLGEGNQITPLRKWGRGASLGWFYGTVTEALGWQHGDGEGKTMGLAPYGNAARVGDRMDGLHPHFVNGDLSIAHDFGQPSFLNIHGNYHWHFPEAEQIQKLASEFGSPHVAARAQQILEQQIVPLLGHWLRECGINRLACGGGLFLNVKLNQRIWYDLGLDEHWVYPNPGDAGLAMGAALHAWHALAEPLECIRLESLAYGPHYSNDEIRDVLTSRNLRYRTALDASKEAAELLADNKTVGWFQGRAESGPRALGNRSILMNAARAENKELLNATVKFREAFRPFCPSLLADRKHEYLRKSREENFMITSFDVILDKRHAIPAVVHVDGTLRPQTVKRETNSRFYDLIAHFGQLTGQPVVLNTSFNIKGEPMVCHPREALRCFFDTGLDALVIGDFVLVKPQ